MATATSDTDDKWNTHAYFQEVLYSMRFKHTIFIRLLIGNGKQTSGSNIKFGSISEFFIKFLALKISHHT